MSQGERASFTELERVAKKVPAGPGKWILLIVIAVAVIVGGWRLINHLWSPTTPTPVPTTRPVGQ